MMQWWQHVSAGLLSWGLQWCTDIICHGHGGSDQLLRDSVCLLVDLGARLESARCALIVLHAELQHLCSHEKAGAGGAACDPCDSVPLRQQTKLLVLKRNTFTSTGNKESMRRIWKCVVWLPAARQWPAAPAHGPLE